MDRKALPWRPTATGGVKLKLTASPGSTPVVATLAVAAVVPS